MKLDRCYIIAEIGVNHNGSMELARDLIDAAVVARADAVKFQTFFADDLVTRSAAKADYQVANTANADSQYSMLKALELTEAQFAELHAYCAAKGIAFLSTPFSEDAADLLERVGVSAFKISSGDLTHLPMLAHIAKKGLPIILSTGMGTLTEIEEALAAINGQGNTQVSLLHCVSNYPASADDCNLAAMDTMAQAFGLPVGWSDHSVGAAISWAAVARGARIVEKHITLDQNLPGPDHKASMEPADFAAFVDGIRVPTAAEKRTALVARRSLVAARDLVAGDLLTAADVVVKRPGTGLLPRDLPLVVGARVARAVAADTPLVAADFHG
jgi:N,N'-diacetyllegionaminate synthase